MNQSFTIEALRNEADVLEERAVRLREAAKAIEEISAKRVAGRKPETNGHLLSSIAVPAKKAKRTKRKYTKRSKFWAKK